MHTESCRHNDIFSVCSQINHNAYCRCINGYHEVEFTSRDMATKIICTKSKGRDYIYYLCYFFDRIHIIWWVHFEYVLDTAPEGKNVSTLLLTLGGVAVLSTLLCFVLKLYVKKSHPYERTNLNNGARVLSANEIGRFIRRNEITSHIIQAITRSTISQEFVIISNYFREEYLRIK